MIRFEYHPWVRKDPKTDKTRFPNITRKSEGGAEAVFRGALNQLTLEAFIWLPKETARKLSNLLSHTSDAPNVRELIGEVRTIILGNDEKIESKEIIIFPIKIKEQEKAKV